MSLPPRVAALGALLADATRASMLIALMDGRAWTATELAAEGQVAASTASSHLARLTGAGLLTVVRQGRYRYFRIADEHLAALLEQLLGLAEARTQARRDGVQKADDADAPLRHARTCYDHLAGACGVHLLATLQTRGMVEAVNEGARLTGAGEAWCRRFGVDLVAASRARRPLCRTCLDWSERRPHLAGAVGAGLLAGMIDRALVRRMPGTRALSVSARGTRFIQTLSFD